MVKPADIILVRGAGFLADGIIRATHGQVSHAAIVIGAKPDICLEALIHVKTNPLPVTLAAAKAAYLMSDKTLSDEQRQAIVYKALAFSADDYNYLDLAFQGLDSLFKTGWFTEELGNQVLQKLPICSYIPARAYEECGMITGPKPVTDTTPQDLLQFALNDKKRWSLVTLSGQPV